MKYPDRRRIARTTIALAHVAALLGSSSANAQSAPPPASQSPDHANDARAEFERGLHLMDVSRFAEASTAFEHSLQLQPSGSALYNLALALRALGAYRRAIVAFQRYEALGANADPALVVQAHTIAAQLEETLAQVVIRVSGQSREVMIDGERVADGDGTLTLRVDPGHRVVEARRPGYRSAQRSLDLAAGEHMEITLDASSNPIPPRLAIETNDPRSQIRIDGELLGGEGRFSGEVRLGSHSIDIYRDGQNVARRLIDLAPGANERISMSVHFNAPIYTRPLFWAAVIGVVVVGAAVAGGVVYDANNYASPVDGSLGRAVYAIGRR